MLNKEWLKNFGQKLQRLREKANRTQTDPAKTIGASVTSYGMYENGTREPSLSSLRKIAAFFNVSIDKLILDEITINNAFGQATIFNLKF